MRNNAVELVGEEGEGCAPMAFPTSRWADNEHVYIGTKIIRGVPMSEHEFLMQVKGKTQEEVQRQETQGDGYKVTYEDGYVSWSPKRVFEQSYRRISSKEKDLGW